MLLYLAFRLATVVRQTGRWVGGRAGRQADENSIFGNSISGHL